MSSSASTSRRPLRMRTDLKVGDRVSVIPYIGIDCQHQPKPGTVVYIHPKLRYYTVLLDEGYRQSFQWGWGE